MKKIPYTKPSITSLEIEYVMDAVTNGWGEECYSYITKFEKSFCEHLGVKHAIATSSATGAIHMGLLGLGIGPRDEVIIANANWIASIAPVLHLGAVPIFVDVDQSSWCIDANLVEDAITPNTKAIIAVHLYGNLCEMDKLKAIARKYNLLLIEDAAEAIGSEYRGIKAGSIGDFGAFSFHGTKTLTTGEGGMFVTNSDDLYENVLTISNHGRSRKQSKQFWPDMLGTKYKISNIQAALGLAQVERIEELINRKREIFNYYHERLKDLNYITMNPIQQQNKSGFWMPTIVLGEPYEDYRVTLIEKLKSNLIDARVFFWQLSSLPFINSNVCTPIANQLSKTAINLPSYHDMTKDDQERVIEILRNI